jgi:hypothetical protein
LEVTDRSHGLLRKKGTARRSAVGLAMLCALILTAVLMPQPPSAGACHDGLAGIAKKGTRGKIIAVPRFQVPEQMLVPARPEGSPTVSATISGKLALRGCFTSTWTDGRKVKCPKPVLRTCVAGRTIEVYASHAQIPRQFVTAGPDGSFTVTVVFEDDFQTVHLKLGSIRTRSKGLRIVCFPMSTFSVDVSEARP